MTTQQLAVLNALVTYAVENIPGGPSKSESEVAQLVGRWVLGRAAKKEYNYKITDPSGFNNAEEALNFWSERGWRVVGTIPSGLYGRTSPTIRYTVILERPVGITHPDDDIT